MATNRIDILDQALLRPGRIDRKIEFPNPNEEVKSSVIIVITVFPRNPFPPPPPQVKPQNHIKINKGILF